MLLQYMAAKLGIVTQMDLAQAIRARTSKPLGIVFVDFDRISDYGNRYCRSYWGGNCFVLII